MLPGGRYVPGACVVPLLGVPGATVVPGGTMVPGARVTVSTLQMNVISEMSTLMNAGSSLGSSGDP